jgi:G3E family GTPase
VITEDLIPVNVLTGFLGSGKTTLLQRLLSAPDMNRTVVLINEFGEIGLDHLLVRHVQESVVLLQNGCICCTIRDDLKTALRDLLGRRDRLEIPEFDRVVIETTGLADPAPILHTLLGEPVIRHHFRLANVIATVDAVNAPLHLRNNPEGFKQVAAADRLVITKTDIADPAQAVAVREIIGSLNPSAEVFDACLDSFEPQRLLAFQPLDLAASKAQMRLRIGEDPAPKVSGDHFRELRRHTERVSSLSLALDEPLDWTAFGIWLSMLLNRHGNDVLRVKGILQVQGSPAPVFINAVQHIVHPPQHLDQWPTDDHRSRIVFITRDIDHGRLRRSLQAFCRSQVAELTVA